MTEHDDTLQQCINRHPDDPCWKAFCRLKLIDNNEFPKRHSSDYYWYEAGWDAAEDHHGAYDD